MTISSNPQGTRSADNQPISGTGKDVVSAFLHSINNPTTQHLHEQNVSDLRANQDTLERDFSTFCAGYLAGITATAKLQLMPRSPEESVRAVWQEYRRLQEQQMQEEGPRRVRPAV